MATPISVLNLINPFGSGAMAISLKAVTLGFIERYHRSVSHSIQVNAVFNKDDIIIYARVPSEKNEKVSTQVFYDVVLEFYPYLKEHHTQPSFNEYGVRVYSNSPSFIYAFTYVFNDRKALPSFIPKKYYVERALKEAPKKRNPALLTGVEESIWFTIFYMAKNHLFRKEFVRTIEFKDLKVRDLLKKIRPQTIKLEEVATRDKLARQNKVKLNKPKAEVTDEIDSSSVLASRMEGRPINPLKNSSLMNKKLISKNKPNTLSTNKLKK